jgi:hypothetical protein
MNKLKTFCAKASVVFSTIAVIKSQNIYQSIFGLLIIVMCIAILELSKED